MADQAIKKTVKGPIDQIHRKKCLVLVISFTDLVSDARVRRQVEALRQNFAVATASLVASGLETAGHFPIVLTGAHLNLPLPLRKFISFGILLKRYLLRRSFKLYERDHWEGPLHRILKQLHHLRPDVIIANDLETLPLALKLAKGNSKVIFDAHEYTPGQHDDDPKWVAERKKTNEYLCRTFMPKADICFTVSEGIAVAYDQLTGVKPIVITNAPRYSELTPAQVDPQRVKIVHHGIFNARRRTTELITLMDTLQGTHELHLYGPIQIVDDYHALIVDLCAGRSNVHLHEAIPPDRIPAVISQYDIGIHHLHGGSFNHQHALPNKFFDFIQARLAIIVGPNPEMAALVQKYDLGVIAADHTMNAFRDALLTLTPEKIMRFKLNSSKAALEFSAERNMNIIRETVTGLCTPSEKH